MGHCFSAAGIVETILGLESIKSNDFHPTLGFEALDSVFKGDEIGEYLEITAHAKSLPKSLNYLLKNSFGFGGVNNSLLFRKSVI